MNTKRLQQLAGLLKENADTSLKSLLDSGVIALREEQTSYTQIEVKGDIDADLLEAIEEINDEAMNAAENGCDYAGDIIREAIHLGSY
jgi:hypothetical protein